MSKLYMDENKFFEKWLMYIPSNYRRYFLKDVKQLILDERAKQEKLDNLQAFD